MAVVNQDQDNNQQNENQNQGQGQPIVTGGGLSGSQGSSSGSAQQSGAAAPQQRQGSGRFQNLSNYLKANQGAGQRLGETIGSKIGQQVGKQKEETQKNLSQLAEGIQSGRGQIQAGQGFNQQLQGIGQGLQSFQNMENRAQFDEAGQQARAFTQQPNFSQFQNIQAGSAIDEAMLRNQAAQTQALQSTAQQNIQNRLNQAGTEEGRFSLLRDVYGGKKYGQQYGAGSARLDQLLLQNDPGKAVDSLRSQFGQQAKDINTLGQTIQSTGAQGEQLITDEADIINKLNTQSQANQDVFNQMLGKQENIDFINQLRQQKVDEYANALRNKQFTKEQAEYFGLSGGQYGTSGDQLRLYNVDTSNPYNYIQQAQLAQGVQDIATEQDYDAYQALRDIANRDTAKLSGASQLAAALQKQEGTNLGAEVAAQDAAFRNLVNQNQTYTRASAGGGGSGFRDYDPGYVASGTLANFLNRGRRGADSGYGLDAANQASFNFRNPNAAYVPEYTNMLNSLLNNAGYDRTGAINLPNSAASEQYKRFSRLV